MNLFAPPTVKKLLERGNLEKLLELAKNSRSSQVRRDALRALAKIGGHETVNGPVQALKDSNAGVREEAERAIRDIVDRLVQSLNDTNQCGREDAEKGLRKLVDLLMRELTE